VLEREWKDMPKKTREIEYKFSGSVTVQDIANLMDHSNLQPQLTIADTIACCTMAKKYKCISCCVRPSDIEIVKKELEGTDIIITTVIGFPHGTCTTETKVFETKDALAKGADEVDMVLNIGRLKSGDYDYVEKDIKAVADAAHKGGVKLKVILENAYFTDEEKVVACKLCEKAGADFTKTSTGYAPSGSKIEDLKLMRANTKPEMQVKAAGGIRTLDDTLKVMAAGAVRVGTRSTEAILEEAVKREKEGTLVIPDEV
jgi:deoxyribose-phosphate aldolase